MKKRPKIRKFVCIRYAAVVMVFLFIAACSAGGNGREQNLILITLDTTRADRLGCYGYQKARTQNLDRIAREGIVFENAICTSPSTVPSHASMMTGLYPPHHGVRVTGRHSLPSNMTTIADIMKREGYATGAVISGYPLTKRFGMHKGFDFYEDSFWHESPGKEMVIERLAEQSVAIALRWIEAHKEESFFLWLHLYDPHSDYNPPPPFDVEFSDDPYDGEIAYMDWSLGLFFKKLKEWGLYENSMLIIVGDHGEGLGEHGESEHQYLIYNTTVKVPFIIRAGERYAPNRIAACVGITDIFPTVLDFMKIQEAFKSDGRSLLPLIEESSGREDDRFYYVETLSGEISLGWSPLYAIMNSEWKFIESPDPELFRLADDPAESVNLFRTEREEAEHLRGELGLLIQQLSRSVAGSEAQLDEEAMKNLASLGYISSGTFARKGNESAKDPKKYIYIEKDINTLYKLFLTKNYSEALPHIEKILKADPENRLALLYGGTMYYEERDYARALQYLEKLYSHYQDEIGNMLLIRIYSSQGKSDEALAICDASIEYFHDKPQYHRLRGMILSGMNRHPEAIQSFENAISIEKTNPENYYYLARSYAAVGNESASLDAIRKSLENGLEQPDIYLRDQLFRKMKRFNEIEKMIASMKR